MISTTTKEQIYNCARELLAKNSNITIRDITAKSYTNIAAINYHFGSKQKLLDLVVEDMNNELKHLIVGWAGTSYPNVEIAIEKLTQLLFAFITQNSGIIKYTILNVGNENYLAQYTNDKAFVSIMLKRLRQVTGIASESVLMAKFFIIFSAFVMPITFLVSSDEKKFIEESRNFINKNYLNELVHIFTYKK